jgi:predicted transposase YbfD/YdcC
MLRLERQVISKKTADIRQKVVAGATNLASESADAMHLLTLLCGHWYIDNKSHGVCDVTFDEDQSSRHCSNIPQVMAALRNTVIELMRQVISTNITGDVVGLLPSRR